VPISRMNLAGLTALRWSVAEFTRTSDIRFCGRPTRLGRSFTRSGTRPRLTATHRQCASRSARGWDGAMAVRDGCSALVQRAPIYRA